LFLVLEWLLLLRWHAAAAPGDLDSTFGMAGVVSADFANGYDEGRCVVVQGDGKILVAGSSNQNMGTFDDFAVARFNADGTPDASFGAGGKVVTDGAVNQDIAYGMALQTDGKIVVVGGSAAGSYYDFGIFRYNSDGTLDTTFGTGGKVLTDFGGYSDYARGVVVQSDGKIVVAGYSEDAAEFRSFALARYNVNGTLDTAFGTGGKATTAFSDTAKGLGVVLQSDGKIVLAGQTGGGPPSYNPADFALARYNNNGTPDTSFGTGGKAVTDFGGDDSGSSVALQSDGKIVVAGHSYISGPGAVRKFALARYQTDGTLDSSFGTGGSVLSAIGSDARAASVAIQPDGKIVAGGAAYPAPPGGGTYDFALYRYYADGSPDVTFGAGGKVTTDFSGSHEEAGGLALQPDGKILLTGYWPGYGGRDFLLIRYHGAGPGAVTLAASGVMGSSAVLNATVDANGASTTVTFQHGLDNTYAGGSIAGSPSPVTGSGGTAVSATLPGLMPNTTYHYRVVATSGADTTNGADMTFTTPNNNADLSSLTLTAGTLTPSFAGSTTTYTASVSNATTSLNVTPTFADTNATATVNGVPLPHSGAQSELIALSVGANPIHVVVTAQDGTTMKDYTVTVTRAPSSNANLSGLVLSAGSLSPSFAYFTQIYSCYVANTTTSTTVQPTAGGEGATITVNGTAVASGTDSPAIPLGLGANVITTVVTAQDGVTTRTYTVTVNRASLADLSYFYLGAGTLEPYFDAATPSYRAAVSEATSSTYVVPYVAQADATVTVNGAAVAAGSASAPISLIEGDTVITIIVTSAGGVETRTYTVIVTRPVSGTMGVDPDFDPNGSDTVQALAVQPDGRILVGGAFATIGGAPHSTVTRLLPDGTPDPGFNSGTDGYVNCVGLQADGKILIGGIFSTVNGTSRNNIARLNADGTLDSGFNPDANSNVNCAAVQPDGKIIIGGGFTTVGGVMRNRIARLNTDGTLDPSFDPNANYDVYTLAIQGNGKILVGGWFSTMGVAVRNGMARLNPDGSLDTGFDPNVAGAVYSLAVQPDGKILIGGSYSTIRGAVRNCIARLNAGGTLDASFDPNADGGVTSIALHADGRILIGGWFSTVGGSSRYRLARLDANGSLDPVLNLYFNSSVNGIAVQEDGRIVVGGSFTNAGGSSRNRIVRCLNDMATQSLAASGSNRVEWLRGGTSPETHQVVFDLSTDGGNSHSTLGAGSRIAGGWELTGLSLPTAGEVRARARISSGAYDGSSGLVEKVTIFGGTVPEIAVEQPSGSDVADGGGRDFGSAQVSQSTDLAYTIKNTGTASLQGIGITRSGTDASQFSLVSSPAASVPAGGSTSFIVRFAPTSTGSKSAGLHISSTDSDENPFDITITGTATPSTNANLSALTISSGTLTPAFAAGTTDYTATVEYYTGSITVTPAVAQPDAMVTVNGSSVPSGSSSSPISLNVGANTIQIVVTAGDNSTTKQYAVTVTRPPNPDLAALSIDVDALTPAFSSDTTSYTVSTPYSSMRVTPTVAQSGAIVTVNGAPVASGTASAPVSLSIGANTINIVVTAADLVTSKSYTLAVTRIPTVPGDADEVFHPDANGIAYAIATQPDGKTVIGGSFTTVGGVTRNYIARLNADGALDTAFNPELNNVVLSLAVQSDGKILVGGYFSMVGGVTRNGIARLNADGTLDTGFNPDANSTVNCIALQADGKVILGGSFSTVGGVARNCVARVDADGTLDTTFNPDPNSTVYCVMVQSDGKTVLGGGFTSVAGVARNYIARINGDGTLDTGFNPDSNSWVYCMAPQADGKVLLGGYFSSVGGLARNYLARINADGTADAAFDPQTNSTIDGIALQADGKILIAGSFSAVGGTARNRIARLNADGTIDAGFDPNANSAVNSIALEADGRMLVSGNFSMIAGSARSNLARLLNDQSTRSLAATGAARIEWLRGATSPEIEQATFELSTDGGNSYVLLGHGSRINGGWERSGLSLPAGGQIRARGRTSGGQYNGSSGLVEDIAPFGTAAPEIAVEQPAGTDISDGGSRSFGTVAPGDSADLTFTIRNTGNASLAGVTLTKDGPDASLFTVTSHPAPTVLGNGGATAFSVRFAPTAVGARTATIHIASNDTDENPFDITVTGTAVLSSNADLAALSLSVGSLLPVFSPALADYTAVVHNSVASVTVTPVVAQSAATVTVNGSAVSSGSPSAPVNLNVGGNTITVLVTAQDGTTTKPYTIILTRASAGVGPGDTDSLDAQISGSYVFATAVQPDGKVIIGGSFTSVLGVPRNHIARLNSDGTLDMGFDPNLDGGINTIAVQPDGKVLIGGNFATLRPNGAVSPTTRYYIARVNADGTLDAGFDPNANSSVYSLSLQPDGKVLIGGAFTTLQPNGAASPTGRQYIARVNADGTLDEGFNPSANSSVHCVALQPDGKVLLGGAFGTLQPNGAASPTGRQYIARVNADGTLDAGFNPGAGTSVYSLAVQADGKVLHGGQGNSLRRVHSDGTADTSFAAYPDTAYSLALQADGRILVCGDYRIARLNSDGTPDAGFAVTTNSYNDGVALQADGKVLICGYFSSPRSLFARINNDPAFQALHAPDATQLIWQRAGTAPHLSRVTFELTTDGGASWTPLGAGTRVGTTADWQLTGLTLPAAGTIRARGATSGGFFSASSGWVEALMSLGTMPPEIVVEQPAGSDVPDGGSRGFGGVSVGDDASLSFTVRNTGDSLLTGLTITKDGPDEGMFSVTASPSAPVPGGGGSTTFTVRFAPASGGPKSAALHIASNDSDENPFDITLTGTGVVNADLASLTLTAGTLTPVFASGTTSYTASVSNATTSVQVTPTVQDSLATVTVNGGAVTSGSPSAPISLAVGANTIPIVVTGRDGITTNAYTVVITRAGNSNANLSGLVLGAGALSPSFNYYTLSYSSNVANGVTTTTIRPTAQGVGATITVNGTPVASGTDSPPIALALGSNVINTVVTAQDGVTTKTYTVTVTRASLADLSALYVSTGSLEPYFSSGTTSYRVGVAEGTSSISITPYVTQAGATVTVNGSAVSSGGTSAPISLAVGDTVITVVVTHAASGETRTYTIAVTRPAPGTTGIDTGFNPNPNSSVYTVATQGDGRIIIGGNFSSIGGMARNCIARLNADGTLDAGFNPNASSYVYALAVQSDGKVIIGGGFTTVGGVTRNRIAWLNPDGTLDTGFNPDANSSVYALAVQPDGKVIIGGGFTTVGGSTRNGMARLNVDGSPDAGFNPNVSGGGGDVFTVAVQPDGKILIGGQFYSVGGVARYSLARVNSDGTLDIGFDPQVNGNIYCVLSQPDGKVLVGGSFTSIHGVERYGIARLNADGTLDTAFGARTDTYGIVNSMALQTDGNILIAGGFTELNGSSRSYAGRLKADGSLDAIFDPGASSSVHGVALQTDGRIILCGDFTSIGGTAQNRIARFFNGPATQGFAATSSRVEWLRGGTSPETQQVSFDLSTDGGNTYAPLGSGTRIAGGWELTGLSLPANGEVRALATTVGGLYSGSSGLVSIFRALGSAAPEIAVEQPLGSDLSDGGSRDFGSLQVSQTTDLTFTIKNTGTASLTGLAITKDGTDAAMFAVTAGPSTPVPGGGSTTFTVRFGPTGTGVKTAALHIASNDGDESPFDITLTGTATPSTNANLSGLAVNTGTLTPTFDGGTTDYTVSVNYNTSSISVRPTVAEPNATVTVNGVSVTSGTFSSPINLNVGANTINVVVTAGDNSTTKTYTVVVTRPPNADLSALTINPGALTPAFSSATTSYTVTTPYSSMRVTPTAAQTGATVTVNGTAVATGTASPPIPLSMGANTINIVVTAADLVTSKAYTLTVTRIATVPGDADEAFDPNANGAVFSIATQTDGKAVIGGQFSTVGGVTRNRIARLNADGTLDTSFNPNANGTVNCITVQSDGKVIVGGSFSTVGGVTRNRIARLNTDGTLDSGFDPNANSTVKCIAVQSDGKVIVGGSFSTVGGVTRNRIARLNTDGTLDTAFDPNANSTVNCIAIQADGGLVVGGSFSIVGGVTRNYMARLNADGTLDTAFDPNADSAVNCIAVQPDGKVIVGGAFSTVGGVTRSYMARLNVDGTLDTGFDPNANSDVNTIALQTDGRVLAGGFFSSVGGVTRNCVARLNSDGTVDAGFNSSTNNAVYALAVQAEGKVLVGGSMAIVAGTARNGIARLLNDAAVQTLAATSSRVEWLRGAASPEVEQVAFELSTDGGHVFTPLGAGTRISGGWECTGLSLPAGGEVRARGRISGGYYNGSSGLVETIAPFGTAAPEIAVEQPSGTEIPDGGSRSFGNVAVGDTADLTFTIRNSGNARLTGLTITKDGPDEQLFTITASPTAPLFGNGATTTFTVRFAPASPGTKTATLHLVSNDADENPFDIMLTGTVGLSSNADLASLTLSSGGLQPAFSSATTSYTAFVNYNTTSITATPVVAQSRATVTVNGLAVASGSASAPISLNPGANVISILVTAGDGTTTKPYSVTVTRTAPGAGPGDVDSAFNLGQVGGTTVLSSAVQPNGQILIGGSFYSVGGVLRNNLARLHADGTLDAAFNPNINSWLNPIAVQPDGKILIGGNFTTVGGVTRNYMARLNPDGTVDGTFNPNLNSVPRNIIFQPDGRILIGGHFTTVGGVTRNRIARLHENGLLDTSFVPADINDAVWSMALQSNGKILIGGDFTTVGGATRRLARLNADGTIDAGFTSLLSEESATVALQPDGKIICGTFSQVTRLNEDGTQDTSFTSSSANSGVVSAAVQADGRIVIGGYFTAIGGVTRNGIARLNANGTLDTGFNPNANARLLSVGLQADGRILLAGEFTSVGGVARTYVARLQNDPASQSVVIPDPSRVEWRRGGASPEAQDVSLELSTDGGNNYASLGYATRIPGGWQGTGLSLPASGEIRARARILSGHVNDSSGIVETLFPFGSAAPEIVVEQPVNASLPDGGSVDFGNVPTGGNTSLVFTVRNTGTASLTGLTITKDGPNEGMFAVTASPSSPVPGNGSTTFTVRFAPTSAGSKIAVLHLASNDADEGSFDITLTGVSLTPLETWRQAYFGTTTSSGNAADLFDYDGDGLVNLLEFAFGLNPTQGSSLHPPQAQRIGNDFVISFTRPAGVSGITYGAEWNTTLSNNPADWMPIADSDPSAEGYTFSVPIGLHERLFMRLTVTVP